MGWLFLSIYWLIHMFEDFLDVNIRKRRRQNFPQEEAARRNYRILSGIGNLVIALMAGSLFVVEVILKIEFTVTEAVCYELLPYSVPILYFLILRRIYRIPWHRENENARAERQ